MHDVTQDKRMTPMRGQGRRRQPDVVPAPLPNPLAANPRTSAIRRKPVPSTVYEGDSPRSTRRVSAGNTFSSAAQEIGREQSPPTPEEDDAPYIHFALDQLTRDEEVRGSRAYPLQGDLGRQSRISAERASLPSPQEAVIPRSVMDQREQARQRLEGRGEAVILQQPPPRAVRRVDDVEEGPSRPVIPVPEAPPRHPRHSLSPEMRTKSM